MRRLLAFGCLVLAACDGGSNANDTSVIALRVSPANPVVAQGSTVVFEAKAFQVNGEQRVVTEDVEWSSSASSIVSIDADGQATANAAGEAYVTAELEDLKSPPQKVTVTAAPTATPTPTPAPTANHVVISEVLFDATTEPGGEFIELHNPTAAPVALDGWRLAIDGGATLTTYFTFPAATTIAAGGYVVVCHTPATCGVGGAYDGNAVSLVNTGEWVVLENASAAVVDEMAYGAGNGGLKPSGWCGTNSPTASANGNSVQRKPVGSDGDTCSDWINNTPATPLAPPP